MGRRDLAAALLLLGVTAAGCSTEAAGHPRPASNTGADVTGTTEPGPASSTPATAPLGDLDLCALLEPKDFPADLPPDDTPLKSADARGCDWTVSYPYPGGPFSAGVGLIAAPFSRFVPPPRSPNGHHTEIAGRKAWLGNPLPDFEIGCAAAFGAGDSILTVTVTDRTLRGVDSCVTTTALAEIVISRTPRPTE